jgi:hypothetical protein
MASVELNPPNLTTASLSNEAADLIRLVATNQVFREELFSVFNQDRKLAWQIAEQKVGSLSIRDKQVLERLVAYFMPDSSVAIYVTNCGCWS